MFAQIPFCEKIAKACEVAAFSKEKYDIYQADMRSERDIAYFADVRYEEGREEEKLSLAKKMKEKGFDLAQVVEITGLSEDVIKGI